jgi:hypothetical protein
VHPSFYAALAESHIEVDELDIARKLLEDAFEHIARFGERHSEAELYRVQASLMAKEGAGPGEIGERLERAIEVARQQQAVLFELRATNALAVLWMKRGDREAAGGRLESIYRAFTEGFESPDMIKARELLNELQQ